MVLPQQKELMSGRLIAFVRIEVKTETRNAQDSWHRYQYRLAHKANVTAQPVRDHYYITYSYLRLQNEG